jgi:type I restriction enzyme S subunit
MSTDKNLVGWNKVKLGDVVTRTSKRCKPELSSTIRWIGADHLDEGDLSVRRWSTTDDPMFPPTFYFSVPSGSVLLHSRNPKKVAILPFDVITGEKLFCLAPNDSVVLDSRFLAYQLQSGHFHEFVARGLSGSVNKFLNWTVLERYEFALPPIDEQKRIADLLRAADNVIDRYERLSSARDDLLGALLIDAAQGAELLTLEEVCGEPITYGIVQAGPEHDGGVPYVRVSDMTAADSLLDVTLPRTAPAIAARYRRSACRPGDLIFALRGPIGLTRVVPESLDGVNLTQGTARLSPDEDTISADYLQWALRSRNVEMQFKSLRKGSTFQELSLAAVRKIRLRVPDLSTQQVIVESLSATDAVGAWSEYSRAVAVSLARSIREKSLQGGM